MPKRPNFRFIATGAILGFLVGAWIAWSGVPRSPRRCRRLHLRVSDGIGIVGLLGAVLFGTIAAVIAVLVDRRNR